MAIDLRQVEPLGSKSVLLEQALKRHQMNRNNEMDSATLIGTDFEWLNDDKEAIQNLVKQMDASIGKLAGQIRSIEETAERSKRKIDKEQLLMLKQITTLNSLLKRQVGIFTVVESQMSDIEIKQNNLLPQIGIGLIAGLMSAVTILATAPWMTLLMENLRAAGS